MCRPQREGQQCSEDAHITPYLPYHHSTPIPMAMLTDSAHHAFRLLLLLQRRERVCCAMHRPCAASWCWCACLHQVTPTITVELTYMDLE